MFSYETEPAGIPRGFDAMSPGPALSAMLASIVIGSLSGRDAVVFARAQRKQIGYDMARQYRAMSRIGDLYAEESPDHPEFASSEIGAALTLTRRSADIELGIGLDLVHRYPSLLQALEIGQVDFPKLMTILRGVGHVDDEIANSAIERILPQIDKLTTGQLAARMRRIVIEADPEQGRKAYEEAVGEAKIWSELAPDGSGTMVATGLETDRMAAANRNIHLIASRLKNDGDGRPIDRVRADVFIDLLVGAVPGEPGKGQVDITVDLGTLTSLNNNTGELNGFGPVIADIARKVATEQQDAIWTYRVNDPATGDIYVGTTSRRPSVPMKRLIRARYRSCVHPTCRRPTAECDIDHTED